MKVFNLDNFQIEPHHILVAVTSEPDYEMERRILLELNYDRFVLIEGSHCSCYDFDETKWSAIEYTRDELVKLANTKYNRMSRFWIDVRTQL